MKRIVSLGLLLTMFCSGLFGQKLIAEGKSFTKMGAFKIETADKPVVIDGVVLETYRITYENSATPVIVAIDLTKKCRRYITISGRLTVQYACYPTHFGIEKLSRKYHSAGLGSSDENLVRTAYFHQKILGRGEKDPVTCMMLIGAYFPELLKEDSKVPS